MDLMNIMKFSALVFTTLEYFNAAKEDMIKIEAERLKKVYKYNLLNRNQKNTVDKKIKADFDRYIKALNNWEKMLTQLTVKFEDEKSTAKTVDFSIDLLHRALDKFTVSDAIPVEDKVKDHIFESLDRIISKERTATDSIRIKASFDNFLTVNKLTK